MTHLAFRNLFQSKARLVVSLGGVALAFVLILALDAVFAGVERQITAYIDHSGADLWVSQEDVRNMHMASSSLPDSVARRVRRMEGIEAVTPIDYLTNNIVAGNERTLAYIIGLPNGTQLGGPWEIYSGSALPGKDEVIIDHNIAENSGVALGDKVEILGEDFKVTGLSGGTSSLVNSVAFISSDNFEDMRNSYGTFSFLLVKLRPGVSAQAIAALIQSQVRDVTAQSTQDFAAQERQVVKDMSTDVITIMNLIGFLIGLAVMALTVYTSTLARRREYGMLKALGAHNRDLYLTVLAQAFFSVALGFLFGLAITLLLSLLIPMSGSNLRLVISPDSLLKLGGASVVIAALSAMIPISQIAGLDPAMVFRGR